MWCVINSRQDHSKNIKKGFALEVHEKLTAFLKKQPEYTMKDQQIPENEETATFVRELNRLIHKILSKFAICNLK